VGLYFSERGLVLRIGGIEQQLSRTMRRLPAGGTVTLLDDGAVAVAWPDRSQLILQDFGRLAVSMNLADSRRGRVEGLWGKFDGNKDNDIVKRGGGPIAQPPTFDALYPAFADSWRITAGDSLFTYEP